MRQIYAQLTAKANKNDEQAWMVGRIVLVLAVFAGTAMFMRGTSAEFALYACGAFVFAYNVPLFQLLRRGKVKQSYAIGFVLDNSTLLVGWWIAVASLAGQKQTNDLYLVLAPMLIIGVARLGWRSGVVYTVAWLTWMGVTHYVLYGPGSYDVEQLPLRLAFLGAGSIIVGRLVARLDSEKRQALGLRSESDNISEIGRLAGSTLDFSSVFHAIAQRTVSLVPYDGLSVTEVDPGNGTFRVVETNGEQLAGLEQDASWPLERSILESSVRQQAPSRFGSTACQELLERFERSTGTPPPNIGSMLIIPVVANGDVIALVIAWSRAADALTTEHLHLLNRIGTHFSGALANSRLHRKSLELERVTAVSEAKSSLLSSVSHELKTPLTSMIAFTDILLQDREANLTDKQKRQLSLIRGNEYQLVSLIDDLLDVSRIETGRILLNVEPVELHSLVDEVVESLGPIFEQRKQRILVDVLPAMTTVTADRQRIQQVLRNLLTNASKYSPESSGIRLTARSKGDNVCINVADSGIGISPMNLEGLFTPFFRSSNPEARSRPGTGLGLAIAKGFVEAHGGAISVDSTPGLGTTFAITLPKNGTTQPYSRMAGDATTAA